jgi:alpha-tubulin suppressor-like RCC1 family protein
MVIQLYIALGESHSCGITNNNLYCWGDNSMGQLGLGHKEEESSPIFVGNDYFNIVVSNNNTCGITSDKLYCWGNNSNNQLGDSTTIGTTSSSSTPVNVGLSNSIYINSVIKENSVCGVTNKGVVHCWGKNHVGQVGDGTTEDKSTPTPISF